MKLNDALIESYGSLDKKNASPITLTSPPARAFRMSHGSNAIESHFARCSRRLSTDQFHWMGAAFLYVTYRVPRLLRSGSAHENVGVQQRHGSFCCYFYLLFIARERSAARLR